MLSIFAVLMLWGVFLVMLYLLVNDIFDIEKVNPDNVIIGLIILFVFNTASTILSIYRVVSKIQLYTKNKNIKK